MRELALLSALFVLYLLGRYTFWLPSRPAAWPRILMLHRVTPDAGPSGMNMPPRRFEQLLHLLQARGARFVTVSELLDQPVQPGSVALTFDDGFADNYCHAFPLLRKYEAKATIYLAPDVAGIERLSPTQVGEMAQSGLVEFSAHTLRHVNLTRLEPDEAEREIRESRARVTALAGACHSFAYPFGRFDEAHTAMVRDAGYRSAVSTRKAIEPIHARNSFDLPRISMSGAMNLVQVRIALAKGRHRL